MAQTLTGTTVPVALGPGVSLEAPGLVGTAELQPGVLGGVSRAESNSTEALVAALDRSGFLQQHAVEVRASESPFTMDQLRAPGGEPGMTLRVPDLGPEQPQVLMMVDEAGVVTWHLPTTEHEAPGVAAFTVDRTVAQQDVEGTSGERGLAAAIGTKLLSVLVVPLLTTLVGKAAPVVARHVEDKNHPYAVRRLTPTGLRTAGADPVADWSTLADGPVLLFLHGTASSSHGAFAGLPDDTFGALHSRYEGRVLAFDHHTLSDDLGANVARLKALLPPGRRWPVDIVSHSRGGLVARALAHEMADPTAPFDVRRVVYVATPNGGTALADPGRLKEFLDRTTTMLNLIPDGPWTVVTDTMSGLLSVVQVLAVGAVGGLPGLATMNPAGEAVQTLPFLDGDGREQYAVDVDFEPSGRLLQLVRGVNGVVDRVFGSEPNDIVVPSRGVAAVSSRPEFTIPPERILSLGRTHSAWHCSLFSQPQVSESLLTWLNPQPTGGTQ